jgi:hypothetical protein
VPGRQVRASGYRLSLAQADLEATRERLAGLVPRAELCAEVLRAEAAAQAAEAAEAEAEGALREAAAAKREAAAARREASESAEVAERLREELKVGREVQTLVLLNALILSQVHCCLAPHLATTRCHHHFTKEDFYSMKAAERGCFGIQIGNFWRRADIDLLFPT